MLYGIIACYNAWDLSYPKQYQVLAFVQEKMFDRREKLFTDIPLIKFEKQFKQLWLTTVMQFYKGCVL